jgi:dihydroorotate dehydrogenase
MSGLFGESIFGFGQALLRGVDPEAAHGLTIRALQLGLYPRALGADDPGLGRTLWGLEFPNPIGMAAGFDKNAQVPNELFALGFGFVEIGTLTPRPQTGNPKPRIVRSEADRAVINRLGFNNDGHLAALQRLQSGCRGVVGVNIGANKESADRIADYTLGIERLTPVAAYFTVNISSPNTPGLRDLQAPDALAALLPALNEVRRPSPLTGQVPPLLLKLAPDIAADILPDIVRVALASNIDGLVISNTTLARDGLSDPGFANQPGGLSGRPLFLRATKMLARVYRLTDGKLPLIGVGGIDSGEAAVAKIEAGASLVQLYTGLIFEGPGLITRIKRALSERLGKGGESSLEALTGCRAEAWADRP